MKKMLTVAIAAAISSTAFFAATDALAQASAPSASPAAKTASTVKHTESVHHAATVKTASGTHTVKHKIVKRKVVVAAEKKDVIPAGADKWTCADGQSLYIKGDMKRDQILTMYYDGKSFQLPRRDTTTGADRFYDMASGMDLVVIPSKAMLFSDKDDDRIADDCMTDAMTHNNEPAPTQSNAILKR